MAAKPRRTWRRRILWLLPLALLAGAAVVWLWLEWFVFLPDLTAVRRIQRGMTEAEVVKLFGAKPTTSRPQQFGGVVSPLPGTSKFWYCDAGIVVVRFDDAGKVATVTHVGYGTRPSLLRLKLRGFLSAIGMGWLGV
jgi:hypothetical protein